MTDTGDIPRLSALALIERYRQGSLSPVDVVHALLQRIEERRGLNAVSAVDAERSLAGAVEALRRYREGLARPLEGVPVLVKDLIDTAGLTTTYGSAMFAGHVPTQDAVVVRRLREAGAIVLGKTTTHEFAWGITTDGTASGPTRNPWNPGLVPGGSSGGSAAALAAGLAPLALGTDTAGSIRIPAAFCGVAGLRPTFGRVPTVGAFPLAPSLDTVGPMARTVEDLELLLSVLAPGTRGGPAARDRKPLIVGVWKAAEQAACAPDITRVCREASSALTRAGARVIPIASAEPSALPDLYATLGTTVGAEGVTGHRLAGLWPERRDAYHPAVRHRLEQASEISLERYGRAQRDRALATSLAARALDAVDVLLSPVVGASPAPIGHDAEFDGARAREFRERVMAFTALQSLTGLPACTVRAGFDDQGLPVGVQLTAAWGHERVLLEAARLLTGSNPAILQRWPDDVS